MYAVGKQLQQALWRWSPFKKYVLVTFYGCAGAVILTKDSRVRRKGSGDFAAVNILHAVIRLDVG
ncbi:MAG: hypothetical protein ACD_39C01134G0001 [uncultured bacterium]|nr:MAG: hypothetical protein ACD_39C01134G0001 [uncultured bacterium]